MMKSRMLPDMKGRHLILILILTVWGCGGQRHSELPPPTMSYCPPGTQEVLEERVHQSHRWCRDEQGGAEGPFKVTYASGRKKLAMHTVGGRVHGEYEAWHPSGRWAVQTAYEHGAPKGILKIRPPFGPHTECPAARCGHRANLLDRAHCLPQEIDAVLETQTNALERCLESINTTSPIKVDMAWQVNLLGLPTDIRITGDPEMPEPASTCIGMVIQSQRFPAPLGGECDVSLDFEYHSGARAAVNPLE